MRCASQDEAWDFHVVHAPILALFWMPYNPHHLLAFVETLLGRRVDLLRSSSLQILDAVLGTVSLFAFDDRQRRDAAYYFQLRCAYDCVYQKSLHSLLKVYLDASLSHFVLPKLVVLMSKYKLQKALHSGPLDILHCDSLDILHLYWLRLSDCKLMMGICLQILNSLMAS